MNASQRLTRLVSAALTAAALIAPTAVASPAGTDPPTPATPDRIETVVSSRTLRCGDLLVATERPVGLPSCPGGWHFVGAPTARQGASCPPSSCHVIDRDARHQEDQGRADHALGTLPCTPSCDPGVLAHLRTRPRAA